MTRHEPARRPSRPLKFDPVAVFFGATPPGPFALLGLGNESVTPEIVLQALQSRLEQLARHPQARTPAGEEVSLALHSAAAQLCDPTVQRMLVQTWGGVEGAEPQSASAPSLERDILLAVGLSGGWNAEAMRRVAVACAARGASIHEVLRILGRPGLGRSLACKPSAGRRRRRSSPVSAPDAPTPVEQAPSNVLSTSDPRRDVLLIGGLAAAAVLLLVVIVVLLTPGGKPAIAPSPNVAKAPTLPSSKPPTTSPPIPDLESGQPRAIQREIVGAAKDLSIDSAAAGTRFRRAYDAFTNSWNLMSADEIAAIVSSIVDYCYSSSLIDSSSVAVITDPLRVADDGRQNVRVLAAAAGVSARLLLERELPREFLDELERRAALGATGTRIERASTFREGLSRNLPALVLEVSETQPGSTDAWKHLIESRDAAYGDAVDQRDALTMLALETLLHKTQGTPLEFVKPVTLLAESLSWQPTEALRGAVFGWLEDATVPSTLLSPLTLAMVGSSAPGVDSTMVLQPAAGPEARSGLRERLAAKWSDSASNATPAPSARPDVSAWESQATSLLEEKPSSDLERLRLAVRIAAQTLLGDGLRAGQANNPPDATAAPASPAPATIATPPTPEPRSPALEYYAAGVSLQARLEVIRQASNQKPDLLYADVLVNEASRGSPASIRDAARKEILRNSSVPSIVLATLRALPSIPETPENAEWISLVGSTGTAWQKRAKWKLFAERALLDRACDLFPVSAEEAEIAAAVSALSDVWRERAQAKQGDSEPSPTVAIEQLQSMLAARAPMSKGGPGKLNPPEIKRRLDSRLVLAQGSIERAVAFQSACAEWMALEAAREQPGKIGSVQSVVEEWNQVRRRASSAVEQLLEGERLMLRLQMIRLQKGSRL